jgi:hypothetical protein
MNIGSLDKDPQAATRAPKSAGEAARELSKAEKIYLQRLYTKLASGYFASKARKENDQAA